MGNWEGVEDELLRGENEKDWWVGCEANGVVQSCGDGLTGEDKKRSGLPCREGYDCFQLRASRLFQLRASKPCRTV